MAFELPRLPQGYTQQDFQFWWQQVAEAIEAQIDSLIATDEALVYALSDMPEISPLTITADYLGVVDPAGQLPAYVQATRTYSTVDVTADSTWSITAQSGAVTATIDAATGLVTITAATAADVLVAESVYLGVSKTRQIVVNFTIATPPATGSSGGGTTASGSGFTSFNSTSMATVSDELTAVVGAAGNVQLSAPLTVTTGAVLPTGTFKVYGIWQWDSTGGGVWVDLGTEVSSSPDVTVAYAKGVTSGALNVPYLKTGLGVGTSQKFRFRARNASGTRVMYLTGTASAVGS